MNIYLKSAFISIALLFANFSVSQAETATETTAKSAQCDSPEYADLVKKVEQQQKTIEELHQTLAARRKIIDGILETQHKTNETLAKRQKILDSLLQHQQQVNETLAERLQRIEALEKK